MGLPFQKVWKLITGNFKLLLVQTVHIPVKGVKRAVSFPLQDWGAPYICSQMAAGF